MKLNKQQTKSALLPAINAIFFTSVPYILLPHYWRHHRWCIISVTAAETGADAAVAAGQWSEKRVLLAVVKLGHKEAT